MSKLVKGQKLVVSGLEKRRYGGHMMADTCVVPKNKDQVGSCSDLGTEHRNGNSHL